MSDLETSPDAKQGGDSSTQMLTALVRMRSTLQEVRLPLELPSAAEQREAQREMVDQLEDYVIPRLMTIEAPLLTVVGDPRAQASRRWSTPSSAPGHAAGVLRPTTRSPVLVHNPADVEWFGQDRLLPDLERVTKSTNDPEALQLVASDAVPAAWRSWMRPTSTRSRSAIVCWRLSCSPPLTCGCS
jgi:hypothetical protein